MAEPIRLAVLLSGGGTIGADLFPREIGRPARPEGDAARVLSLAEAEEGAVRAALAATGWNKTEAARLLGISRPRLQRKIRDFGLAPPD